jgi:hypothetical protein
MKQNIINIYCHIIFLKKIILEFFPKKIFIKKNSFIFQLSNDQLLFLNFSKVQKC